MSLPFRHHLFRGTKTGKEVVKGCPHSQNTPTLGFRDEFIPFNPGSYKIPVVRLQGSEQLSR